MEQNNNEIYEFYNRGAEIGRLNRGLGIIEFERSKDIISSYLFSKFTDHQAHEIAIYDIGVESESILVQQYFKVFFYHLGT